jgi:hypothetical protein
VFILPGGVDGVERIFLDKVFSFIHGNMEVRRGANEREPGWQT